MKLRNAVVVSALAGGVATIAPSAYAQTAATADSNAAPFGAEEKALQKESTR